MPSKLNTLLVKATEQKYAAIIASIATVAVLGSMVWQVFFTHTNQPSPVYNTTKSVSITEKPNRLQQAAPKPIQQPKSQKTHAVTTSNKTQRITIGKGKLYVQVGAFKEVARARVIYEKMRKTYKRAQVMPKSGYYAVWVGPISSQHEAESLKKQILKRYKIKGFITSEK